MGTSQHLLTTHPPKSCHEERVVEKIDDDDSKDFERCTVVLW